MNFQKKAAFLLICILSVTACKKDDEESTKMYFSIYPGLDHPLPAYSSAGEEFTFKVYGAERAENDNSTKSIGYFASCTGGTQDTLRVEGGDEVKPYRVTIPDTLGTFTINAYAFAEGYYNGNVNTSTVIVRPGLDGKGTITGFETEGYGTFKDGRDNTVYYFTTVGDTDWMRTNLQWNGAGISYEKCGCMDGIFGRFYNWNEAQTACPDDWTLPVSSDFDNALAGDNIGTLMGDFSFNGEKMWDYLPDVRISDSKGLSILPYGYGVYGTSDFTFTGRGYWAVFWTSDEDGNLGVTRYIYEANNILYSGSRSKSDFYAPVRCIRKH